MDLEQEQSGATLDKFGRKISNRSQDKKLVHVFPEDISLKYDRKFENLLSVSSSSISGNSYVYGDAQCGEKISDVMSYININSVNDVVAEDFLLEFQGKWSKV